MSAPLDAEAAEPWRYRGSPFRRSRGRAAALVSPRGPEPAPGLLPQPACPDRRLWVSGSGRTNADRDGRATLPGDRHGTLRRAVCRGAHTKPLVRATTRAAAYPLRPARSAEGLGAGCPLLLPEPDGRADPRAQSEEEGPLAKR